MQSTIRIQPHVAWPKLGDGSTEPTAAEDFFKRLENRCRLANNGKGMHKREMIVALQQSLSGSRATVFDNVIEERSADGDNTVETDPGAVYEEIKRRLLRFRETATERELQVQGEWDALAKTKHMTALQFEALWEARNREFERVRLGLLPKQKYTQYLWKVGKNYAEAVRLDRRARPDRSGGEAIRTPETWAEAHQVVVELESIRDGNRAMNRVGTSGTVGGVCEQPAAFYSS